MAEFGTAESEARPQDPDLPQHDYVSDNKIHLETLMRVQSWIQTEFKNLSSSILNDVNNAQYLHVVRSSPHPLLVTQPSTQLICRVEGGVQILCRLQAFNSIVIREISAHIEEETKSNELRTLLTELDCHQGSICKGIPEDKIVSWAWATKRNLSHILIERFLNRIVFRDRSCSYVILESDHAEICRSCALLMSTCSLDAMIGNDELECPQAECDRTFKYQGALEKHILKHSEEMKENGITFKYRKLKLEGVCPGEDSSDQPVKMEPVSLLDQSRTEADVKAAENHEGQDDSVGPVNSSQNLGKRTPQMEEKDIGDGMGDIEPGVTDDNDFLDRLLDDLDGPKVVRRGRRGRKRKAKKEKPATKDFSCSDCDKVFYYEKNLFSHVVEAHGKSLEKAPKLEKPDVGGIRRRRRKGRGVPVDGSGEKDVFCEECGVSFKFASGLYNHRKRMHGDIVKKPCPHCAKLIKSCTLDQHIREEHGTPRFACQFCGKGFYYKSFMLNHQRLHTGDYKECICDLCGAVYKSVQVLNRHVRNAHQDLRNHKCEHCDKAFHNKQRLERHINSQHTKSRLWPCPVCNTKYDRKDNLRTHIKKNHSGVLNLDTVELQAIDNDGMSEQHTPRKSRDRSSSTTNASLAPSSTQATSLSLSPSNTATLGLFLANHSAGGNQDRLDDEQVSGGVDCESPVPATTDANQLHSVNVAQDLLNLKYGAGEDSLASYRPEAQVKLEEGITTQHLRISPQYGAGRLNEQSPHQFSSNHRSLRDLTSGSSALIRGSKQEADSPLQRLPGLRPSTSPTGLASLLAGSSPPHSSGLGVGDRDSSAAGLMMMQHHHQQLQHQQESQQAQHGLPVDELQQANVHHHHQTLAHTIQQLYTTPFHGFPQNHHHHPPI